MGSRVICATPHKGRELNNYSLGDRLGKGAFAVVYKAMHLRTAEVAAIKQIPLEKLKSVDSIMSEIELLQELQHPNIVKYLGFMKDDQYLSIVLEYCENGSLTTVLKKFGSFPENLISRYMRQVLEGLMYLHHQGTIHRDIKGANILTTKEGVAKLADFGVAMRMSDNAEPAERPGVVGTPHWMAPEIIQMQEPSSACDIWSLGATIVELRTGQPPYGNRTDIAAMYAIVQQDSPAMIPADCSNGLRDFLTLCFEKNPRLRVTAKDLLSHVWIKKFNATEPQLGVASPEKAVQEWNSPSRKKRLAVPSILNLKNPKFNEQNNNDIHDSSDSDIEQDFMTLNVFGANRQVNPKQLKHKPLQAFVEDAEDVYDDCYTDDVQVEIRQKIDKTPKKTSGLPTNSEDEISVKTSAENSLYESPHSNVSKSDIDPFNGLEDLLEDDLDEELICAQNEAKKLISLIASRKCDLTLEYLRLIEIAQSIPVIKKQIDSSRLFTNSLRFLPHAPKQAIQAFLKLLDLCIPSGSHDMVVSFCISGGLSFVLSQKDLDSAIVLQILDRMTTSESKHLEDDKMGIARQLAFREDAIEILCSFFQEGNSELSALQASSVVIRVFNSCGPRYRGDLWHHFNTYHLFKLLIDWLHLPCVLKNNADNILCSNIYTLILSFNRAPQDQLVAQVDQRILRRLMRAYIRLPLGSPHRVVLLEFFKNVSTLVPVLDAMYKGNVAPHLIAALRRALHDPEVPDRESRAAANCLVPTLFNYARIERARQREVAQYDVLVVLQDCVRKYPALKEFVFPIFSALAHANHGQCWDALWSANGLQLFIKLVTEPGWQAMAIAAISIWLQAQPTAVKPILLPHINVITQALTATTGSIYESVLSAVTTLLDQNRYLCKAIDTKALYRALQSHISHSSSASLVQCLQVVYWSVLFNHEVGVSETKTIFLLKESKLWETLLQLETAHDIPLPCKRLINQIFAAFP